MSRSAVEIVRAYGITAWNEGRDDWIPELCADPIIRHDANREVRLSHAEQRARMRHNYEELRPVFEPIVLAGDDEYVTLVWNVTGRDPSWKLCGIEIFRVVDSKITEVWNSTYMDGRWGLSKTLGASIDGGAASALPLVQADLTVGAGRVAGQLLVPAESRGIAKWLAHIFGRPRTECADTLWRHRFAPGGRPAALSLTVADSAGPAIGLENIDVTSLSIELERSGLVNANLAVAANGMAPRADGPFLTSPPIRLADTFGSLVHGELCADVVDAAIVIAPSGEASGRVTLQLQDPEAAFGDGRLSFGWREGGHMLMFEGDAALSAPFDAFTEAAAMRASYTWRGSDFQAIIVSDSADPVSDI